MTRPTDEQIERAIREYAAYLIDRIDTALSSPGTPATGHDWTPVPRSAGGVFCRKCGLCASGPEYGPVRCDGDQPSTAPSTGTATATFGGYCPECRRECIGHRNARENTGAPDADMAAAEAEIASNWDSVIARAREEGRRAGLEEAIAAFPCELGSYVCTDDRLAPCESCAAARRLRALAAPSPGIGDPTTSNNKETP